MFFLLYLSMDPPPFLFPSSLLFPLTFSFLSSSCFSLDARNSFFSNLSILGYRFFFYSAFSLFSSLSVVLVPFLGPESLPLPPIM
eukprot:m.60242 g.60242  ORF g.60242 m.60242 type:complete len:85 (-) comp12281_c0_seq1:285-539(-)